MDQQAELRGDSALTLLRRAMHADTTSFLAFDFYQAHMASAGRHEQLFREFPELPPTAGSLSQCRALSTRLGVFGPGPMARSIIARLTALPDATDCRTAAMIGYGGVQADRRLAMQESLLAAIPEWLRIRSSYVSQLNGLGRTKQALGVLRDGLAVSPHPIEALDLQLLIVAQHDLMLDSVAAGRLLAGIGASVSREGRPHQRRVYLRYLAGRALQVGKIAAWDSLTFAEIAIARAARATVLEFQSFLERGSVLALHFDDPRRALVSLNRAVFMADSSGMASFVAAAHSRRARVLFRMGEFSRAEADLLRAIRATPVHDVTALAEIHHARAHNYEARGQWTDAAREVDLNSRYAWEVRGASAAYMMSLHDAGVIRWKAGWHAAARQFFDSMVTVIEERKTNYYYAGEYYERIGNYFRAAEYYRRGLGPEDRNERHLNLAGLTRMYDALGFRDSARATIALHDQPGEFTASPLLPALLLADGRTDEALGLARAALTAAAGKGSRRGLATARIELARLLLSAGQASEAGRQAASAERLASSSGLVEERIEALVIQGIAETRDSSPLAVNTLLRARALVRVSPTAESELRTETALGDALATVGRDRDALTAYRRAATAGRQVTASYESALDRARSGERRMTPFHNAVRLILSAPELGMRSEPLLAWSSWKKHAALSYAGGRAVRQLAEGTIASVRNAIGSGTALVDYVVADTTLFAIVVTPTGSSVLRLPLSVSAASRMVQKLRRPLTTVNGGQLDMARASFDLGTAHDLYAGLVAPFMHMLDGIDRIVVIPDGPLYGVPFGALPTLPAANGSYHAARYLIDRFSITLSASAVAAGNPQRPVSQPARVLVMQRGVPGGDAEARFIAAAWPRARLTLVEPGEVTETSLRKLSAGRTVLHLAVHARADEADPLSSYLELSSDASSDGLLHVNEVAALKFTGDLVVLTACRTLPGPEFAGTGPFGIATSFIAAGARNVLATHWPVGESAAELSRTLHQALARGVGPSDALREAQLQFRRNPLRAHPFYWGGYVMIASGDRR